MFNYEQLLQLNYPVYSLTFWRIFCPVRLFHHVRLLILGESPPLCDYFILFVYLILKSSNAARLRDELFGHRIIVHYL